MNQFEITAYVSFKQEMIITAETYEEAEKKVEKKISGLLGDARKNIRVNPHINKYTELPEELNNIHYTLLDLGYPLEQVRAFAAYQANGNLKING